MLKDTALGTRKRIGGLAGCESQTRSICKVFENCGLPFAVAAFARAGCVVAPVPLWSLTAWRPPGEFICEHP